MTGFRWHGFAYERLTDAFRYDRVQGISLGLGYRVRAPGLAFTNLYGTVRYGFSDERVTGRLSLVRDAPDGQLTLGTWQSVCLVDLNRDNPVRTVRLSFLAGASNPGVPSPHTFRSDTRELR